MLARLTFRPNTPSLRASIASYSSLSTHPVGIFWDIENCPPYADTSPGKLIRSLRTTFHPFGPITTIRSYQDVANDPTTDVSRASFGVSGLDVIDTPHLGRKETADKRMSTDICGFALSNPAPSTIVIISTDRDYCSLLAMLSSRKYNIILVTQEPTVIEELASSASILYNWTSFLDAATDNQKLDLSVSVPIKPTYTGKGLLGWPSLIPTRRSGAKGSNHRFPLSFDSSPTSPSDILGFNAASFRAHRTPTFNVVSSETRKKFTSFIRAVPTTGIATVTLEKFKRNVEQAQPTVLADLGVGSMDEAVACGISAGVICFAERSHGVMITLSKEIVEYLKQFSRGGKTIVWTDADGTQSLVTRDDETRALARGLGPNGKLVKAKLVEAKEKPVPVWETSWEKAVSRGESSLSSEPSTTPPLSISSSSTPLISAPSSGSSPPSLSTPSKSSPPSPPSPTSTPAPSSSPSSNSTSQPTLPAPAEKSTAVQPVPIASPAPAKSTTIPIKIPPVVRVKKPSTVGEPKTKTKTTKSTKPKSTKTTSSTTRSTSVPPWKSKAFALLSSSPTKASGSSKSSGFGLSKSTDTGKPSTTTAAPALKLPTAFKVSPALNAPPSVPKASPAPEPTPETKVSST